MNVIRGYVGIPYVDKGRSFEGCDCYGLPWLIFRRVAGILLPVYDWISSTDTIAFGRAMRDETESGRWRRLGEDETPQPFDLVAMIDTPKPGARAWHCGIVASPGTLLHSERGVGSHLTDLARPEIAPRLKEFFRHLDVEARP